MGARTGQAVIEGLRERPAEIWHRGALVRDVTVSPGFANGVRSLAGLYDLQWREPSKLLERDPASGDWVGRSFSIPANAAEVVAVGAALKRSADHSMGMMGREPAYLNRCLSAYAGAAEFFGQRERAFAANVRQCYARARSHDLALTHTLINPRPDRTTGPAGQSDPGLAAHVVRETSEGIVIAGCRLLATLPMADEIAVMPTKFLDAGDAGARYAFGAVIPTASPGLKFICRDTVDYGFPRADHPLGARFEEMDAVVVFDDVLVPWERVLCYRDTALCAEANMATGAIVHMAHQALCKNIAKTEYLLGLVSLLVDGSALDGFAHVQEKVADIWVNLHVLKSLRRASEADCAPNAFGVWTPAWDALDVARQLYPAMYPRMVEILQQIGASGLVAMPSAADLNGPLAADIKRYFRSANLESADRIRLYKLAWDTCVSAFANRQVLYERYFFGDPVQMKSALFRTKDRSQEMERVRSFLETMAAEDAVDSATRDPGEQAHRGRIS